jgi:hypothetical protein
VRRVWSRSQRAGARGLTYLTDVRWFPGGSHIAFVSIDDMSQGPAHLDGVHADGSSLRRVADGDPFDWSPDGKRSAIAGRGANVSVVNADGTDLHRIARCRCDLRGPGIIGKSVAWSLDGTRIAYTSGGGNTVSTIRPEGSGATVVATQAARGVAGPSTRTAGYWYPSSLLWRPTCAR